MFGDMVELPPQGPLYVTPALCASQRDESGHNFVEARWPIPGLESQAMPTDDRYTRHVRCTRCGLVLDERGRRLEPGPLESLLDTIVCSYEACDDGDLPEWAMCIVKRCREALVQPKEPAP